jgi:hypothetical protein
VKTQSAYARADEAAAYRSLWLSDRARWLEAQKRRWVRLRVKIRSERAKIRIERENAEALVISSSAPSKLSERGDVDVGQT